MIEEVVAVTVGVIMVAILIRIEYCIDMKAKERDKKRKKKV